jgi:hypothetical protein
MVLEEHDQLLPFRRSLAATGRPVSPPVKPPGFLYSIGATVSWASVGAVDEATYGAVVAYDESYMVCILLYILECV